MYSLKNVLIWAKNHARSKDQALSLIKSLEVGQAGVIRTRLGVSQVLRINQNQYDVFT